MHEVHSHEGIVLAKRAVREADLLLSVFTPEGLLRARALSARRETSKLRYALEPLTAARYGLVRGRQEWRLVGAVEVSRRYLNAPAPAQSAMARVGRLLLRLVAGQEPSRELFSAISEGFDALAVAEDTESLEIVLVLRVLSHLGYLPESEALAPFIDGSFSVELSAEALRRKALLVRTINESLRATGL